MSLSKKGKFFLFIISNLILLILTFWIAFKIRNYTLKKKGKPKQDFMVWFNEGKITIQSIIAGLLFGLTYGFLNNLSLWMGLHTFSEYLPGGLQTKAGLGNTYSDFMGAALATAISSIGQDFLNYTGKPVRWINIIAMPIGCLLGMGVGHLITHER